jgi:hypothetical protein
VTARDGIPAKKFGYWLNISPLLYSNNPQTPATVGAPDPHDIVAHYNDIVVAFAFYNELKQPLFIPPRDAFLRSVVVDQDAWRSSAAAAARSLGQGVRRGDGAG